MCGSSNRRGKDITKFDALTAQLRRRVIAVGLLTASVALWGVPAGTAAAAAASPAAPPPAPAGATGVAYTNGRAYVAWQPGSGTESDTYVVQTFLVSGAGPQPVGTQTAAGLDTVVAGLTATDSYTFAVEAVNASGTGPAVSTNPITAVGSVPPPAPTNLAITARGTDNEATISWVPPSGSPAPEWYNIGVYEGTATSQKQVGSLVCYSPCRTKTIQVDPGTVASVHINGANATGGSGWALSNQVAVVDPCPLACLTVDATSPGAAEAHSASGFLHSIGPLTSPPASSVAAGVAPLHWRISAPHDAGLEESSAARAAPGADLTEILSDDWIATHNVAGYAVFPWANWAIYQAWVTTEVQTIEAEGTLQGFSISYWEVQNEPMGGYYYSNSAVPPASVTVANLLQQFLVAYRAIKAADPGARVEGPALTAWSGNPSAAVGGLDMRTFLDFCALNGITPDAISFHDTAFAPGPDEFSPNYGPNQPSALQGEVDQLQAILAARPSLGRPAILVNEYGGADTSQEPGWDVGYIAALEAAGVTGADRSCWNTCQDGWLDGLLAGDGHTTLPGYWVYDFYAGMNGAQLPVSSTFTDVTGLATIEPSGAVQVLVGRHQNCAAAVAATCPILPVSSATVAVKVPFAGSASVTSATVPMGATMLSPLAGPIAQPTQTVPVVGGEVTVTTPALADGDAFEMTIYDAATTTSLTSSTATPAVGQPVTYTATVTPAALGALPPSGTVTVTSATGTLCTTPLVSGTDQATCTTTYDRPGTDTVTATYSGDVDYVASTSPAVVESIGSDSTVTSLAVATTSTVVGEPVTYTATVTPVTPGTGTPTGTVTISGGSGILCVGTLDAQSPDQASCSALETSAGTDAVTASYGGDTNYGASALSTPVAMSVTPASTATSIASSDPAPVVGEAVVYTATVVARAPGAGSPTGTVTFNGADGPLCTAVLDDANADQATCSASYGAPGAEVVTAAYAGDGNFSPSASLVATETVSSALTATSVAASPAAAVVGQSVTYTATVTAVAPGAGTPRGTVTFSDANGPICSAPLTGTSTDQAACSTAYTSAQSDTVSARYPGDADFAASDSQTVGEAISAASTTTALTASNPTPVVGQTVKYTATVAVVAPGKSTPTGTVTFSGAAGVLCNSVPVNLQTADQATCATAYPAAGSDSVTATYSGDPNDGPSAAPPVSVSISAAPTATTLTASTSSPVVGQPVTYTASVASTAPGTGSPTGSVTFTGAAGPLCTAALNASEQATCTTHYANTGNDSVTAVYSGDPNFLGSTSNMAAETVSPGATTVSLSPSATAALVGQAVTYTATVTPTAPASGTPSGAVTFATNGGSLCTTNLTDTVPDTATCTTTYQATGSQTVKVTFGGSASYLGSVSNPVTVSVSAAPTTTTLTASAAPSVTGQSVTFGATVAVGGPLTGIPTGQVVFTVLTNANQPLACGGGNSQSLKAGQATCTIGTGTLTPSLAPLSVTASYSGSGGYQSSQATIHQSVNPAVVSILISSSRNPSPPTSTLTFTATVRASSPGTGTPAGSITFSFSPAGSLACSGGTAVKLSGSGTATCKTTGAIRTSFTITATYAGSAAYKSGAGTLNQTVT